MALMVKTPFAYAEDLRDMGSIPGLGRSPGGRRGNPLQYSCLGESHGQSSLQAREQVTVSYPLQYSWASLVAQTVKNPPAVQETQVHSLGWEDPVEKGMATHSSFLAWKIPLTEESGRLQFMGSQRVGHN